MKALNLIVIFVLFISFKSFAWSSPDLKFKAPQLGQLLDQVSNIGFEWKDQFWLEEEFFEANCSKNLLSQKKALKKIWGLIDFAISRADDEFIGAEENDHRIDLQSLKVKEAKKDLYKSVRGAKKFYYCKTSGSYYGDFEDHYFMAKEHPFRVHFFLGWPD